MQELRHRASHAHAPCHQGARDEVAGGGGDAWALDPTLLKRMAAVRDAERGLIVQVRRGRAGKRRLLQGVMVASYTACSSTSGGWRH